MKYKVGDKFIIEIESIDEQEGLYKVKGLNIIVFEERILDRLEQIYKHDGCDGCRYEHLTGEQEPCESCLWNCTSKFEPQPEEIQVGDEVEYDGEFGIVVGRGDAYCSVLDRDLDWRVWEVSFCHRTGKTYPDLIKAIEQLP